LEFRPAFFLRFCGFFGLFDGSFPVRLAHAGLSVGRISFTAPLRIFQVLCRLTFRLYLTFWPAHKAMRSISAGQNVPEKNPTKGVARLGFFGGRAAYRRRSRYSPVMCSWGVPHNSNILSIHRSSYSFIGFFAVTR
jgi:hypothetical protein